MKLAVAVAGLLCLADAKMRIPHLKKKKSPPPPPMANRTTTEHDYWRQWEDFRDMTGKRYLTQSHHDERFEIFKNNIDKINRHNSQGHTWWMGVTQFADLTADEFKEQIVGGCTLPENKKRNELGVEADTSDNPLSVDWTTKNVVTPVKNQGQCGSCWAFSTTGAVESAYAIKTGQLNSLSEQELVDCAGSEGNNGCRGGLMDYGFEYVKKENGLCKESEFPYDAKTETRKCNQLRSQCQHYDPITGYYDVKKSSTADLEEALTRGPVSVAIEADQTVFQLYKGGVITGRCGAKLDHGVLAVGYDNSQSNGHWWKVKNSWGSTWGEQGYFRLCKDCGANRGQGQCGILESASQPTV